jgi:hypothetical protein
MLRSLQYWQLATKPDKSRTSAYISHYLLLCGCILFYASFPPRSPVHFSLQSFESFLNEMRHFVCLFCCCEALLFVFTERRELATKTIAMCFVDIPFHSSEGLHNILVSTYSSCLLWQSRTCWVD